MGAGGIAVLGVLWLVPVMLVPGSAAAAAESVPAAAPAANAATLHPETWPSPRWPLAPDAAIEAKVAALLARMTIEEKVGQVVQGDIANITPADMKKYHLGSILNGGGSSPGNDEFAPPAKWLALADEFYKASTDRSDGGVGIPALWGTDAMHGHSNIVGAVLFPHNIGLGATRNPALLADIARITSEQVRTTGIDWIFAPTLTVPQDDRWGRTYEGYSEDPAVVADYAGVFVRSLQGSPGASDFLGPGHVIASAKHFLADGGTAGGRDQGDARIPESALRDIHNAGYVPAIEAGVQTIMVSFSSWNGVKHTGNRALVTDLLKQRMNFGGFTVGDWNAHGQVPGCTNTDCPQALNAGLDMYMAPDSWKGLYENLVRQVRDGTVPRARLDDAVTRILRVKFRAGLFEAGLPSRRPHAGDYRLLASSGQQAVARDAVRQSLVLLKNNGGVLPVAAGARVLVTGDGADNIGKQSGGWTITWQGTGLRNSHFPGATSVWGGISAAVGAGGGSAELSADGRYRTKPDVAFVVFGEDPYAEFQGDLKVLALPGSMSRHLDIMRALREQHIPVVAILLSGRPLWQNRELNLADAYVAAWLPGTEGGGIADVLFRRKDGAVNHDFTGKLSFSWPRDAAGNPLNHGQKDYDPLFPFGFGLTYAAPAELPQLPEDPGVPPGLMSSGSFLERGVAVRPWSLDVAGARVKVTITDDAVQEGARRFEFTGGGPSSIEITGAGAADLSREANGDVMLQVRLRRDAPVPTDVTIGLRCGPDCGAILPFADFLAAAPAGQFQMIGVPLKCFAKNGANMARVTQPLVIRSAGRLGLSLSQVSLGTAAERVYTCP